MPTPSADEYALLPRTGSEARAAGLKHYFTGLPCKHGHVAPRVSRTGNCTACHLVHSKKDHAKHLEKRSAKKLEWRQSNPERYNAAIKAWQKRHPEKVKASSVKWRAENRGADCARAKSWNAANPDRRRENRKRWEVSNPERKRELNREWARRNPDKIKVIDANKRAVRRGAVGRYTREDEERIYKQQTGKCGYCRTALAKSYHVDHIQAVSRGGTNWPSNIQLLCETCNTRKNASDPIEFAQRLGLLL